MTDIIVPGVIVLRSGQTLVMSEHDASVAFNTGSADGAIEITHPFAKKQHKQTLCFAFKGDRESTLVQVLLNMAKFKETLPEAVVGFIPSNAVLTHVYLRAPTDFTLPNVKFVNGLQGHPVHGFSPNQNGLKAIAKEPFCYKLANIL